MIVVPSIPRGPGVTTDSLEVANPAVARHFQPVLLLRVPLALVPLEDLLPRSSLRLRSTEMDAPLVLEKLRLVAPLATCR